MTDADTNRELTPVKSERSPLVEQVADLSRERYVQAIAGSIWAANSAYNFFVEKQDLLTSVLHGVTNPANTPLYTPQFQGELGKIGALSQEAMYFVVGGAAVGAVAVVLDNRTKWREGRGTIGKSHPVILAECDGLPLFVDLGQELSKTGQLENFVLSKTAESPTRTSEEEGLFKVWVANAGGPEKDFFDTRFWERSGAKTADAIVLNSSNLTSSKEAAVVIREQLGNDRAKIIIVVTNTEDIPTEEIDKRTGAHLVSPYIELTKQVIQGLKERDVDLFMPKVDARTASTEYKRSLEEKRQGLLKKISNIDGSQLISIYLQGDLQGPEGKGLSSALQKMVGQCTVVDKPEDAQVALYFGSGEITDDSSVMVEASDDPFKERGDVMHLRIPFDRDNEDNALGHGDGTISFERATNSRLAEILGTHVKYKISLKDRIGRLVRRGAGREIRRQTTSQLD